MNKEFLDDWIEKYSEMFEFSGSVAVLKKGEVIYKKYTGAANRELSVPVGGDTQYRIYSMTKPLCAIGLMRLAEKGLVSLDEHPGKYISGAEKIHSAVTLRMLLTHSSGLPDFRKSKDFEYLKTMYPTDDRKMLESVTALPLDFEPGTKVNYINTGFFIISMVIEAVFGMKWNEFMEEKVFKPLGMKNTYIDSAQRLIANRAEGYDVCKTEIVKAQPLCIDWMKGAGAAVSTLGDICRFHNAIRNRELLSEKSWNEIFTSANEWFGLGCMINRWHGKLRYTHNGGFYGFRSLHIMLPEDDFGIIILSNSGYGNVRAVLPEVIYNICFGETQADDTMVLDKGFAHNSEMSYPVLTPCRPGKIKLELDKYVGIYTDEVDEVSIFKEKINEDEVLCMKYKDGRCIYAYPTEDDLFFNLITDDSYRFDKKDGDMIFMGMKRNRI